MFSTGGVFGLLLIVATIVLIVIVMKRKRKKKEKGICQEMKKRFTLRTILNLFIVCLFVCFIDSKIDN
jgi:multisubunit Na+/H+ antiporter MnhB subunit